MQPRATKQLMLARITELIDMGNKVLASRHTRSGYKPNIFVDQAQFHQWKTSSIAFLKTKLGSEGTHLVSFIAGVKHDKYDDSVIGVSILNSAKDDIEGDHLLEVEALVSAEIFDDFMEMAEYLLEQGYYHVSASLVGAILEESLRRLADRNNVKLKSKESISSLNQKLTDSGLYNRLKYRQIQAWEAIRNAADHGEFDEYGQSDVIAFFSGVREFLADYG